MEVEGLGSSAASIAFKPLAQGLGLLVGSMNHMYKVLVRGTEYVNDMYC